MNLSGILVAALPEHVAVCVAELDALPGVEVHYQDARTGRILLVQEAESVPDEVEGLKRIKTLPNVLFAELVYHYFAEDDTVTPLPQPDLDPLTGMSSHVLERLNRG